MIKDEGIPQNRKQLLIQSNEEQGKANKKHYHNRDFLNRCEIEIEDDKFIEAILQVIKITYAEYKPAKEHEVLGYQN